MLVGWILKKTKRFSIDQYKTFFMVDKQLVISSIKFTD